MAIRNLAGLYVTQHKYAKAQPLLERLLAIREEVLGANHPKLQSPLQTLSEVYIAQHNYTAAEPLYRHLLSIQEKAVGQQHPEYAASLTRYAFLLHKLKRKTEAAEVSAQARVASSAVSAALSPAKPDRSVPSAHTLSFGESR
jgi:tetratricopeptide (TPR) repeat protein